MFAKMMCRLHVAGCNCMRITPNSSVCTFDPAYRGEGLAKQILNHLADYSRDNGITTLRLETGIHQIEAVGLYEKWGFSRIPPFGDYQA